MEENQVPELPEVPRKKRKYTKKRKFLQHIRTLKAAKAIMNPKNKSIKDAYKELYPNQSQATVDAHYLKIVTPEVVERVKQVLSKDQVAVINKDTIVKLFMHVITLYFAGGVKTGDFIRALENLKELVPDFKQRTESSSSKSEDEINKILKDKFGIELPDVTTP